MPRPPFGFPGRDANGPPAGLRCRDGWARGLGRPWTTRRRHRNSQRMQIALSGSSGFLGRYLERRLEDAGHMVRRLVRTADARDGIVWNPEAGGLDPAALSGIDAVVHLAGEPIAQRWTRERKRRIRESRVRGTETIARAMVGA